MTSEVVAWGIQLGLIILIVTPVFVLSCYRYVSNSRTFDSFRQLYQEKRTLVYATFLLYAVAGVMAAGAAWVLHTDDPLYFPVSAGILLLVGGGLAVGLGIGTRNVDQSQIEDTDDAQIAVTLFRGTGWVVAITATLPLFTPRLL